LATKGEAAMENATSTLLPEAKGRWFRKRNVIYLLVLLSGCAIAFLAWDALFMPADLRRMQGAWKVRYLNANGEQITGYPVRVIINSRSITPLDEDGNAVEPIIFQLVPERREMLIFEKEETKILGMWLQLPVWLARPKAKGVARYGFEGDKLALRSLENEPHQAIDLVRE
jgi:hypothetical protein